MQLTDTPASIWEKGYNNYGPWLKEKYPGHRVFKVIVDGNFTCPNRDGSKGFGGCTYCNVDSFTPSVSRNASTIKQQVMEGMERARKGNKADKFIIYFQPNTNTYAPVHYLKALYDEALSYCPEDIVGLSVGTRPDCIDAEKIALLESYTDRFDVDLEMGMESIYNETLDQINRGCSHDDLLTALKLVENSKLDICVHTIFGFPWETREMMLKYADEINRHPQIKFVKFHHLHIVEGSVMGVKYKREPFKLFGLDEYAGFLCELLPLVRPDVVIQRLFGLSDRELLIAPNWGLKKSEIQYYIDQKILNSGVVQGSAVNARQFSEDNTQ
ncbi:TIGR01212 family radical SAM protein [Mucilaginibacter sp. UR6-11]|uniref:TIGR01212 family radical SAM protein n=1 Tax=Mucilaginibacter sp. UR6-11 TaxID=1435644 RepID=UPI001E3EEE26|nr:TIGR01212 family radical SAM protein [Mucilaginibacter sp. UR6-11]MCC8427164.1 TIGR01212 family radical SAM protein [Mucilaginibacter sp. UR6-11]